MTGPSNSRIDVSPFFSAHPVFERWVLKSVLSEYRSKPSRVIFSALSLEILQGVVLPKTVQVHQILKIQSE
jgi:hypothetical protein